MIKLRNIYRSRFVANEDANSTIEAVLWLPVFFAFFVTVTDASFIYFGQNKAYRIVQDANRQLSIGRLQNADEVKALLTDELAILSPNAAVASVIDAGVVTSSVNMPASDLVAVGLFTNLVDANVYIISSHYVEY